MTSQTAGSDVKFATLDDSSHHARAAIWYQIERDARHVEDGLPGDGVRAGTQFETA